MNANTFFKVCMGLSVLSGTLLFGTAALMYASRPMMADSPQQTYRTGKYTASMTQVYVMTSNHNP